MALIAVGDVDVETLEKKVINTLMTFLRLKIQECVPSSMFQTMMTLKF